MDNLKYDEIFDTFKSCYVGREIKKNIILEKIINKDDKEIIDRFVTNIYIKYSIKAEIINKNTITKATDIFINRLILRVLAVFMFIHTFQSKHHKYHFVTDFPQVHFCSSSH